MTATARGRVTAAHPALAPPGRRLVGPHAAVKGTNNMRRAARGLVLAMVFTIPWENTLEFPGAGTVSKLVGLAAAAVWLVQAAAERRVRKPHPFIGALLLFTIWSGLTTVWSIDPSRSAGGFLTNVQIFLWLFIMWDVFGTRTDIRRALQAYVLGAYVSILGILANFAAGRTTAYDRYGAAGFQVDAIALVMAIGIPAAWFLAAGPPARHSRRIWALVNYAYLPLASLALVLTGTRGAAVASIPTAVFLAWSLARNGPSRFLAGTLLLVVTVAGIAVIAPPGLLARIASTTGEISQLNDLNGRIEIWRESLGAWREAPILGVGNDAHRAAIPAGKVAHNLFLSVLVETGLVGVVLFANVIRHVLRSVPRHRGWETWFWGAELAVLGLGSLSLSTEDAKSLWLFLALVVIDSAASGRQLQRAGERRPEMRVEPAPAGPRR